MMRRIRSSAIARPADGSRSMSKALKITGPLPTSKRVGSPVRKRGSTLSGANPMTLSIAADREAELAPCLEKFVPLVQQAQIDYVTSPDEINTLLAEYNDNDLGAPFWKTSLGLNAAAVDIMKSAELVGNGPDVLSKITRVGHDAELDPGVYTCGKDGQSVPVGVGLPTVRIDGITVGGTGT